MKGNNFKKTITKLKVKTVKHSPEILTGIGIAGMITTTVLAVKATPKALILINEAEEAKDEPLTKMEVIKTAWKPYIPATVTCIISAGCLIGAQSVNGRRIAAISTAYKLSETALTEFKDKAVEVVGEKKAKDIKNKIAKDKIEKNPVTKNSVIITDKGETLCYEAISGRYFKSDMDKIKNAEINVNHKLLNEDYISLNDFYNELGLDSIDVGDKLGWRVYDGKLELEFSSQIADNGTPCIVVGYAREPVYDFDRFA